MGKVRANDDVRTDEDLDYPRVINFEVDVVTPCPSQIFAVYVEGDEGDEEYAVFPVVLFAVGTLIRKVAKGRKESAPNSVCGMVSNVGGLVMVEHAVDMKFIGYWRKDCQPWRDFLADHELELPPDFDGDDDQEYEDESELNR